MYTYIKLLMCASVSTAFVLGGCVESSSTGSGGGGGEAPDAGNDASQGWYPDGSTPDALPSVPPGCTELPDAGLNPLEIEYSCPGTGQQATGCAIHPYPACLDENPGMCPAEPPYCTSKYGCPLPSDAPILYDCLRSVCVQGCGDVPCPSVPCPASASTFWTCGPEMPDLAPGCAVIATSPAPSNGHRYGVCCNGF